ncbi:hypothetical protein ONS95_008509 [Cadophora gregata]|uniref:uncharacterized protein n=1 Tax=Cadophora gregata TaxID=51156 RepID=UPI0026DAC4F7|nr:uncharacterized protein ONS95_008509 [Cadophora gregata]KAK0100171.1 hypothetical protein ONS95_008509 [Cadophora gregata]
MTSLDPSWQINWGGLNPTEWGHAALMDRYRQETRNELRLDKRNTLLNGESLICGGYFYDSVYSFSRGPDATETGLKTQAYSWAISREPFPEHPPIRHAALFHPAAFITLLWRQLTFLEHKHVLMRNQVGPKFGARFLSYIITTDNDDEYLLATFLSDSPEALADLQECRARMSWHRDTLMVPTPDGELSLFQHAERFLGMENRPFLWQKASQMNYPPHLREKAVLVILQSIEALTNGLRILDHYCMGIIATSTGAVLLSRGHVEKEDIICNMHGYDCILVLREWLGGFRYVGETSKMVGRGYCWDEGFRQIIGNDASAGCKESQSPSDDEEAGEYKERRFKIL